MLREILGTDLKSNIIVYFKEMRVRVVASKGYTKEPGLHEGVYGFPSRCPDTHTRSPSPSQASGKGLSSV